MMISWPNDHDRDLDQNCRRGNLKGNKLNQSITFHELEPLALQALHELVSLVHDRVNVVDQSTPLQSTSKNDSTVGVKGPYQKIVAANLFHLEDDPVAKILWILEPLTLQNVFLAMVVSFYSLLKLTLLISG